jgi:hypothetical protein
VPIALDITLKTISRVAVGSIVIATVILRAVRRLRTMWGLRSMRDARIMIIFGLRVLGIARSIA